jgi:hypothetical protein
MARGKQIAALLIGVTIVATLFTPITTSIAENTGTSTVEDERLVATLDEANELRGYQIQDGTVTVEYDDGAGYTTATQGSDYTIDREAGTITPLSTGNISGGDELRVDYTYQATSGSTTTIVGLVPLFMGLIILVTMYAKMREMM